MRYSFKLALADTAAMEAMKPELLRINGVEVRDCQNDTFIVYFKTTGVRGPFFHSSLHRSYDAAIRNAKSFAHFLKKAIGSPIKISDNTSIGRLERKYGLLAHISCSEKIMNAREARARQVLRGKEQRSC